MRKKVCVEKFMELSPKLTARGASVKLKGKIYTLYSACVRCSLINGSETRPMKVEDKQRLDRV